MNVLILAELVTKSGVGMYIKHLTNKLVEYGDNVHILTYKRDIEVNEEITVHMVNKGWKYFPENYKAFEKIIKDHQIDVVYIQHRIVGVYPLLYNFIKKRVPVVYILHTAKLEQNSLAKRMLTDTGDLSVAISSECEKCLIDSLGVKPDKIRKIYNGVDNKSLYPLSEKERLELMAQWGIRSDDIVICMHGRIDPVKGHDVLLAALLKLSDDLRKKVNVVVSGDTNNSYYREIKEEVDRNGMTDMFSFVGWVDPRSILGVANLLVAPSRREGFPLFAIEAFFMKVPVIRTRTGGYEDMKDYCVGTDVDNADQIKDAIESFLLDNKVYDSMVENAYEWANKCCTIDVMARATRDVFNEVLHEHM